MRKTMNGSIRAVRQCRSKLCALGLGVLLTSPALADVNDDAQACRQEIIKNEAITDATVVFKSAQGSSMKKLRFELTQAGAKQNIICKIKRGTVVEIIWPEGF